MARRFEPRAYQTPAIQHLLDHPRCALNAGMGMGKTVSSLIALSALEAVDEGPALVIAPPLVARSTWPTEAAAWDRTAHLEVVPLLGTPEKRLAALQRPADVNTINYELVPWLIDQVGRKGWRWPVVVADESTKLKNFRLRKGSKRAAELGKIAHSRVNRWVNLSGGAAPNGLEDLWGQMWFIDGGRRLGRTLTDFRNTWFSRSFNGFTYEPRPYAAAEIADAIADVCLALRPEDYFDLRQPLVQSIQVPVNAKLRKAYQELERQFFTEISGAAVDAATAADKSGKCCQLSSGAVIDNEKVVQVLDDAKLDALEVLIAETAEPLIVCYQWRASLTRLLGRFPNAVTIRAEGAIERWNAGEIPLLLLHPASAAHGLNLQHGGRTMAFFDNWWNLEEYEQAVERIGPTRQAQSGYDRTVRIYHLVAEDTMDDLVLEGRAVKDELQNFLRARLAARGHR